MEKQIKKIISHSDKQTIKIAQDFAQTLNKGSIIGLIGDLGSGKTIFTKGMAKGLKIDDLITSPTFNIVNIYQGDKVQLFHFDLYRLISEEDLENIGYEEYFFKDQITIVEWADKAISLFPAGSYMIYFKVIKENEREIIICQK